MNPAAGLKRRLVLTVLVVALAIAASVLGYHVSRASTNEESYFGDFDSPDRIELTAWITDVNPTAQRLSMTITNVRPMGKFADADGNFADDATLIANGVGDWRFPIAGGDSADDDDVALTILGPVTDYPFDHYVGNIELHVWADGTELPTAITVWNSDAFFEIATSESEPPNGGTYIDLSIRRSASTLVFAGFIMVLMLGLAGAAAVAAHYVLHGKRGLDLTACSLMAAMLFALIPLRNAVPGDPPIGSIIDFGSFFIAEATIAISLISCVVLGYRQQLKHEHAEIETRRNSR